MSTPTLTPEQIAAIAAARRLGSAIRRAVMVAKSDGWTVCIFGALTLLLSIGSIPAMLLGAAMLVLGILQLRSAGHFEQLRPGSAHRLALHQFILGILICLYGLSMALIARNDPHPLASISADPDLAQYLAPYEGLTRSITLAFYLAVAAIGLLSCWLTALYYRSREKRLHEYQSATPSWILDLQRAGMKL